MTLPTMATVAILGALGSGGGTVPRGDVESIDYQEVIKLSVDLWLKNGRKSTLMLEWCLIINVLCFVAWRRPARLLDACPCLTALTFMKRQFGRNNLYNR